MKKSTGFSFLLLTTLGALGYVVHKIIKEDEFSDDTKNNYEKVIDDVKNVGNSIQRTYTSIGDKKAFTKSTEALSKNAKNLASKTGTLVKGASKEVYNYVKDKLNSKINKNIDEEYDDNDDINYNYIHHTNNKKKISKKTTKSNKKPASNKSKSNKKNK